MSELIPTLRLADLEAVIERGQRTFVEVGEALAEIREQRLYRETHETFDAYCHDRWGMSRVHAHRTIEAAETVAALPIGNAPRSESVARELAPLKASPDRLKDAWGEVVEEYGARPTAAQVRQVVARPSNGKADDAVTKYTSCPTCKRRLRADKPIHPRAPMDVVRHFIGAVERGVVDVAPNDLREIDELAARLHAAHTNGRGAK